MPFHLTSNRKFFLPDKSIIYELAILLEGTMADTVSYKTILLRTSQAYF